MELASGTHCLGDEEAEQSPEGLGRLSGERHRGGPSGGGCHRKRLLLLPFRELVWLWNTRPKRLRRPPHPGALERSPRLQVAAWSWPLALACDDGF